MDPLRRNIVLLVFNFPLRCLSDARITAQFTVLTANPQFRRSQHLQILGHLCTSKDRSQVVASRANMQDRGNQIFGVALTFLILSWITVGLRCYVRLVAAVPKRLQRLTRS